jgi:hypothetical protein
MTSVFGDRRNRDWSKFGRGIHATSRINDLQTKRWADSVNQNLTYILKKVRDIQPPDPKKRPSDAAKKNTKYPSQTYPPQPPVLTAVPSGDSITISWGAVANASSYNLYWSNTHDCAKGSRTLIPGATSPYVHSSLTPGTTYYYGATSVNSDGESALSAEVNATPMASPVLTVVSTTGKNTITWPAVVGATGYDLYWSTTSGFTKATGNKISSVTSPYVHSGLGNGTTYYYAACAKTGSGEGSLGSEASGMPNIPVIKLGDINFFEFAFMSVVPISKTFTITNDSAGCDNLFWVSNIEQSSQQAQLRWKMSLSPAQYSGSGLAPGDSETVTLTIDPTQGDPFISGDYTGYIDFTANSADSKQLQPAVHVEEAVPEACPYSPSLPSPWVKSSGSLYGETTADGTPIPPELPYSNCRWWEIESSPEIGPYNSIAMVEVRHYHEMPASFTGATTYWDNNIEDRVAASPAVILAAAAFPCWVTITYGWEYTSPAKTALDLAVGAVAVKGIGETPYGYYYQHWSNPTRTVRAFNVTT